MKPILIIDYGMGNLRSVQKAFEKVGHEARISPHPEDVDAAEKVVLPGVGAFKDAARHLRESHFAEPIARHIDSGKPFLGICLGLQLLFERGHEDGTHQGLGILRGDVVRFDPQPGLKIPHMGWNSLNIRKEAPIFRDLPGEPFVYFVHGYYPKPTDADVVAAEADYPGPFCCAVWRDNLMATQFHPEKSQRVGLAMLRNFAGM